MIVAPPHAAQLVGRPTAADLTRDLVFLGQLEGPAMGFEQRREHFDRCGILGGRDCVYRTHASLMSMGALMNRHDSREQCAPDSQLRITR